MEANITNFSQGEISPLYYGRIDTKFYASSAKEITNMFISPSGALTKRPGTKFSGTHRYAESNVRLVPVTVGTTKYVLELGSNYFRIHKDGTVITDGGEVKNVITPWAIGILDELDWVEIDSQLIVVHDSKEPRIIYNGGGGDADWYITTIDWYSNDALEIKPPTITLATDDGGEIVTTWLELVGDVDVSYKKFDFKPGDVGQRLYLKTESGKVGYFEIDEYIWSRAKEIEVLDEDGDPVVKTVEVDVSAEGDPPEYQEVEVLDVDGLESVNKTIEVQVPDNRVTGVYNAITGEDITEDDTITFFAIHPMDMSTIRPSSVASVDSRLVLSGFEDDPRKIMGSCVGRPFEFRMGLDANLAYEFTIKENFGNRIYWISGERSFVIGTDEGIFTIGNNEPVTPITAFQLVRQTAHRCKDLKPVLSGDFLVFVQAPGTQIRLLQYNYEQDKYLSPSLTAKAEHMFRDGIVQLAYQQSPVNAVYAVLENGKMGVFIYDPEAGVSGWTSFQTDGDITGVVVVPGADDEDDVYLSVRRVTDGNTYYHMEKLEFYRMDIFEDAWYVDSGFEWEGDEIECTNLADDGTITFSEAGMSVGDIITFESDPTGCTGCAGNYFKLATDNGGNEFVLSDLDDQAVSGLLNSTASFIVRETATSISAPSHYDDGVEVSVFTETGFYTEVAVSGGVVTIPTSCRLIRVGFPFTARVTTLPIPVRIKNVKEVYEVGVMFFESHAGTLKDADGTESSNFSMDDDIVLDEAADLWTGVKRMHFYGGQSKYGNITIESAQPTAMNIMAITYEIAEA